MTGSNSIGSSTLSMQHSDHAKRTVQRPVDDPAALILEAWSQGLMTGSLVIMAAVTYANMRPGVLLHKLILLELILALAHGTFIFAPDPVYGWYLATTAIGLIVSWSLHNVIAWMKNTPFMGRKLSLFYIGTIILAQPYWATEIYANFAYFNNINLTVYEKIRPWEALFRDPWWIYTTCNLFWVVKTQYNFGILELVRECPRFGLMLVSMCLSIVFIALDVISVTGALKSAMPLGINPFWKVCSPSVSPGSILVSLVFRADGWCILQLCFMFKCLCDTIILDDFKTALDKLSARWLAELSRLWEQLDHITAVVQGQTPRSSSSHDGRQDSFALTAPGASLGFPFMVIQSEAFMNLLGLEQSLPVLLEHVERGRKAIPAQSYGANIVMVDLQEASILLNAFWEQIHTWYPILHADYTEEFIQAITSCFPTSVKSCLTLLVLAIGCVVECESVADALRSRPEAIYIEAAMKMLPCAFAHSGPRSAQCLLLFAIYHLCHGQPFQAYDFVAMASYKLQNYIINELDADSDATQMSILANCFCEITVQLDLVNSGIRNMTSFAPVPTSSGTWTWHLSQSFESSTPSDSDGEFYPQSNDLSYFVAEIAMRKMLQRCTWSTSTLAQGSHVYAPIVAAELERQLDEWLQLLPQQLSFRASSAIGSHQRRDPNSAQVEFLRTQYYAFKASIYWPAVYEALTAGEANSDLLRHCTRFFTSFAEFVPSAAAAVVVCKPNLWTLCTSVFTISMAALAGLTEPCLVGLVPREAILGLKLAIKVLDGAAEVSPSLAEMGAILKERVQLYDCS
ncbi:hypothetical protein N7522_010679 [Penicillium canescens]|nr:hypothetical protein N7522_010679 [Penicillium canescens]